MTEPTPDPATGDDGLPDDVGADPTVPDDGTPQPFPDDVDVQDPDGTEADEAGA